MRTKLPRQSQKPGGEPQKAETPCGLGDIPAAAASVILATPRYRILAMCIAPRYYGGRRKPSLVIVNKGSRPGIDCIGQLPAKTGPLGCTNAGQKAALRRRRYASIGYV